jgi:hypothetical protein
MLGRSRWAIIIATNASPVHLRLVWPLPSTRSCVASLPISQVILRERFAVTTAA